MSRRRTVTFAFIGLFSLWWFGRPLSEGLNRIDRRTQLQAEVSDLEAQKRSREMDIAFYQTEQFVESEARNRLHWSYPGERILIIPDQVEATFSQKKAEDLPKLPVYRQWIDLFIQK